MRSKQERFMNFESRVFKRRKNPRINKRDLEDQRKSIIQKYQPPRDISKDSNSRADVTFNTLTVLMRQGLNSDLRKSYHSQSRGTTYRRTRQTNRQTDNQAISTEVGKACKRRIEESGPVADHRTLVLHSAVITPPAVAPLVNDALR